MRNGNIVEKLRVNQIVLGASFIDGSDGNQVLMDREDTRQSLSSYDGLLLAILQIFIKPIYLKPKGCIYIIFNRPTDNSRVIIDLRNFVLRRVLS